MKNTYYLLRHGQAYSNTRNILSSWPEKYRFPLTKKGIAQVKGAAKKFKKKKLDLIFSSDLLRTKQTAEIIAKELKIKTLYDKRLREYDMGVLNGLSGMNLEKFSQKERFLKKIPKGENYRSIEKRMFSFIKEMERKYKNKKMLIVSHQVPIIILLGKIKGLSDAEICKKYLEKNKIKNGEIIKIK